MIGWHRSHTGREFEQTLGDSEGQGSLVCYSPWGHKRSDTTEQQQFPSQFSRLSYFPITSVISFSCIFPGMFMY